MLLLLRDLRRTWRDGLRRPITLGVAALIALVLLGTLAGRDVPSPWWFIGLAAVLLWEAVRGWRRSPRSRLWEAGIGAFAMGLLLGLAGLGIGVFERGGPALLAASAGALIVGLALAWLSRAREPRPWRTDDPAHYERRRSGRVGE